MESTIIPFYLGEARHPENAFYIEEIWLFNSGRIRMTHNVLQWLFPLNEISNHYLNAPVLSDDEIEAFRTDDKLRSQFLKSLAFYMKHLGLEFNQADKSVKISGNFNAKKDWITQYSHTYLRITRVLKCLVLFDFRDIAANLFEALKEIYGQEHEQIGAESLSYWMNAVK